MQRRAIYFIHLLGPIARRPRALWCLASFPRSLPKLLLGELQTPRQSAKLTQGNRRFVLHAATLSPKKQSVKIRP